MKAQVHVYASPDEGALDTDERLCSDADSTDRDAVRVVFHIKPTATYQGWQCNACGYPMTEGAGQPCSTSAQAVGDAKRPGTP